MLTGFPKRWQKAAPETNILDLPGDGNCPNTGKSAGDNFFGSAKSNRSNSGSLYGNAISMTPDKLTMLAKLAEVQRIKRLTCRD